MQLVVIAGVPESLPARHVHHNCGERSDYTVPIDYNWIALEISHEKLVECP